jgi:hypothetical protein
LGGKPRAGCNVEDAHARRDMSGPQQKGNEVGRNARESAVVTGRRFVLVAQVLWHSVRSFGRANTNAGNAKG